MSACIWNVIRKYRAGLVRQVRREKKTGPNMEDGTSPNLEHRSKNTQVKLHTIHDKVNGETRKQKDGDAGIEWSNSVLKLPLISGNLWL